MDRRRRPWAPIDVDLLSGSDGHALFDRFGFAGIAVWVGFFTACQKSSTRGRLYWSSENEAVVLLGLDGYQLVDNQGRNFTIAEFFIWTGKRRMTRTRCRSGVNQTENRRWEEVQPRTHRANQDVSNNDKPPGQSQKKGLQRGADRAQIGREKGANGAVPYLPNLPPTTSVREVVGGDSSAHEGGPAVRDASGPPSAAGAQGGLATAVAEPDRPPPLQVVATPEPDPPSAVPRDARALVDALAGRPPGWRDAPEPRRYTRTELAAELAARGFTPAELAGRPDHPPGAQAPDLPAAAAGGGGG